jgi:hypothetical protein
MRPRPRPAAIGFDNRAVPAATVTVSVRYALGGIVAQCTWLCDGCLDGDDQPQALKWARQAAAVHASHCWAPSRRDPRYPISRPPA